MDKGKARWLKKFDYLITNHKIISVFASLSFCVFTSLLFFIAFGFLSAYWFISVGFIFFLIYFIYLNNNAMLSISKDLPNELKKEFHEIRIFMNTFLFVPLKKVKSFRNKVINWNQEENK